LELFGEGISNQSIKISVEDPLIRDFDIFEVVAHCLQVETEKEILQKKLSTN